MATDYYTSKGLNTLEMSLLAEKYRHQFEVAHVDLVNIVEIIEFKIPLLISDFKLVICEDSELNESATTQSHPPTLFVRETIYDAACEGDADCRFILAHELGHLLLHRDRGARLHRSNDKYEEQFTKLNSVESAEKQADMFARHFLIPLELARKCKDDPVELSRITGSPLPVAKGSITIAKRAEMHKFRGGKVFRGNSFSCPDIKRNRRGINAVITETRDEINPSLELGECGENQLDLFSDCMRQD